MELGAISMLALIYFMLYCSFFWIVLYYDKRKDLLKDPETSKQIIDYLQKNPDKLKSIFGRVIGKKNEEEKSTDDSLGV